MSSAAVDVAVVGAGIVGCAIAWECARRGASVSIVDAGEPGGQASAAAAGMLAPASEAERPGAFLDLGVRSLAMWAAFDAALDGDTGLALDGLLRVAFSADDAAEVRDRLAWQAAAGIAGEWLDAHAAHDLEPALAAGATGAGWYRGEGHVDSRRTVAALLSELRRLGASIVSGQRVAAPLAAGVTVVAAGAWSGEVATSLGARPIPVSPVRGQLLTLEDLEPVPRRVLYGGRLGYAVGRRDGSVLVGATEEDAGFDSTATPEATERLLGVARTLLAGAGSATRADARAGLRPRTPDGMPILGELDAPTRVIAATGHHRNGVLLAPVTAVGIADLALEGRLAAGWEAFSVERFADREGGAPGMLHT